MTILSIFTFLAGFFFVYNTSKRAKLGNSNIGKQLQKHPNTAKRLGLLSMIFSLCILIITYGLGTGIFYFLLVMMTIASMVIVISPLRSLKK